MPQEGSEPKQPLCLSGSTKALLLTLPFLSSRRADSMEEAKPIPNM